MRYEPGKPLLYGVSLPELKTVLSELGEPAYRADQVCEWLYKKRVTSFGEMTNLSARLQASLSNHFELQAMRLVREHRSGDATRKLLFELGDGSLIETVIISAPQSGVGLKTSRKTICISTQVGCAYGCKFCASGLAGWKRDLLVGEIVAQLIHVCQLEPRSENSNRSDLASFDNIVVMGMGEPLANYDNLLSALKIVNAPWGLHFGARRITISTSGIVPKILKLADEPIGFRLAVSLHGATDAVREQIMPINRKYPLAELVPAVKQFAQKHGRMVTLEFILIEAVNDSVAQAQALAEIARQVHAHVNLIPYNTVSGLTWKRPPIAVQERFAHCLRQRGVSVTLRREKGHAIDAACGQLRLKEEAARG